MSELERLYTDWQPKIAAAANNDMKHAVYMAFCHDVGRNAKDRDAAFERLIEIAEAHGHFGRDEGQVADDAADHFMRGERERLHIESDAKAKSNGTGLRREQPNGNGHDYSPPQAEWPVMGDAAYHGLAGQVVRTISPHSEADPVALLLQFLTCAGNVIGPAPYRQVEGDRHRANLFVTLVGDSAKARKGTSFGRIISVAKFADEQWAEDRLKGGLSSGEGFINEVRDEVKRWSTKDNAWEVVDPGIADKRLLVVEPEFAGVLSVMERAGNTLSPIIRKAWDGGKLATMTRNSPLCATGAHVSMIGHITEDELRSRITRTDMGNGFANRFLFALIKRSKELPFGGTLTDSAIPMLGEQFAKAVRDACGIAHVEFSDSAKAEWGRGYHDLSAAQPGLLGAVTARAEAQALRLALIYALIDGVDVIDLVHLRAGLSVWEYCEASAVHIFGNLLGDPAADEILRALQQAGAAGMTRTAIRDLFGRNRSSDRIGAALALLMSKGRARMEMRGTGGRPSEVWFAITGGAGGTT